MTARPPQPSTWEVRASSSENRCIHRVGRSMRQSFALKFPRSAMVSLCVPCRIAAAYSSGSVKLRTELDVTLPLLHELHLAKPGHPADRNGQEAYHLAIVISDF